MRTQLVQIARFFLFPISKYRQLLVLDLNLD